MERIHAYKRLPDYGHGLLGGINLYDLEMLFDELGLMFYWCNEDYTDCEITIPHIFERNGYDREYITECLINFRDEADASEDYIKLTTF